MKNVSESGSLTLQDLSSDKEGIYTCELSNDEETYTTNTLLRIEEGSQTNVTGLILGLLVGVIVVVLAGLLLYFKMTRRRRNMLLCHRGMESNAEMSNI